MSWCERCNNAYFLSDSCDCRLFECSHDSGEWEEEIYAKSHESAAELHAREYNECGDYPMMEGGVNPIEVTVIGDGVTKKFKVRAEPTIDYYATEAS